MGKYFQKALSSMVTDVAYGGAVRHLYDKGLSVTEIQKNLDYPVSIEKIETIIRDYETQKATGDSEYEYVQKQDSFGKRSFIRVKKQKYE